MSTETTIDTHRAELHGKPGRRIQAEHLADLLHAEEKAPFAKRVVAVARDVVGTGEHDPETHDALVGGSKGKHHASVVLGILRAAGMPDVPATLTGLVELAKTRNAWVSPKGKAASSRPAAGDVVIVAHEHEHREHAYVVCSISDVHLESLDSGVHEMLGSKIVEYRSRQWTIVQPRDEAGKPNGLAYIEDSAHVHLEHRRHPARVVSGWVDVAKLAEALSL